MADLAYVGQRVVRVDAAEKVTGRALYGVDLKLPGMLQAKILRSTLPHVRIVSLDTTRAERLRGVRAVVIGKVFEQLHLDRGRPLNPSFIEYKIPCTLDIPALEAILVEAEHRDGPFGAKGLGEPGLAPSRTSSS